MAKKSTKKLSNLFDSDEEVDSTLKTNTNYAKHYNEFRKKEILSHLNNMSESEDSSEDDVSTDEELVNPEFDEEFFKTLAFLKNKDPKKYDEIPKFFENVPPIEETVSKTKELKKHQKPITVADHQREILLKTEGKMSDDDEEDNTKDNNELCYVAEQEKIKKELKTALMASDSDDDDDKLFQVRDKSKAETESEKKDYEKWLLTQKISKSFKPLKDFWTSNELNKDDKFLRDYILNKKYMNNGNESEFKDIVGISDDEKEVEMQDEYEHKYNFRFEQPDSEFIKRYPRNIEDSVRVENTSRKEKRKEREERKAKEKELKMKEIRELQNIRKREIEEKLMLLKDVAGKEDFELKEEDLNSEFDPEAHDKRMAEFFNNEYYGIDEGDQKPQFDDIDEELNIENWDNFDKNRVQSDEENDEIQEPHCEDDEFNMDCDYDPKEEKRQKLQRELIDMTKGRKRKKKVSKLAALIKKEKPVYDPQEWKSYEEYLDEYYKLDFEDIIGDQPCRFNYTECVPNDFGLTVEEILTASNKELNQWASLKKTMQNRPKNVELNDVEKYNRWRNNINIKKKILKSIYGESEENRDSENEIEEKKTIETSTAAKEEEEKNIESITNGKKKKKRSKKKKSTAVATTQEQQHSPVKSQKTSLKSNTVVAENNHNTKITNGKKRKLDSSHNSSLDTPQKFKKKKFDNEKKRNQNKSNGFNDSRLQAFGINPKKFHNKIKYGGTNKKNKN
ncbi:hypothetical protein PVAND_008946 [Polypedilum vanderplanki]|uniref:Protein KRI1 homolog n=1 Tax=Polypedilum vanderplanki TaxID=319348 RepID=A0A9J6CB57_POLVA|nr:hypothetical protein PVAND_008946 [Polypedilum vanderplanki]